MRRKMFLLKMLVKANKISNNYALAIIEIGTLKEECAEAVMKGIISFEDYKDIEQACEKQLKILENRG